MHLTVMVPGLFVPAELAAELAAALPTSTLARLLARAVQINESTTATGLADADWLAREVFGTEPPAPTAPYARTALAGVVDERQVWHADPIHVAIGRESLIVRDLGAETPDDDEADALIAGANELCVEAGCELQRFGGNWFLSCERAWSLRQLPLPAMIGASVPLPAADEPDALLWSRLHNAIQMNWHMHSVNQARESSGRLAINGLWLHGGGRWKPLARLRWPRVHTGRAELRGAATAAGAAVAAEEEAPQDDALLVWDDALYARRRMDWPAWLEAVAAVDRRLSALPAGHLELVLAGEQRLKQWRVRPSDRFRVWRQQKFAEALAE